MLATATKISRGLADTTPARYWPYQEMYTFQHMRPVAGFWTKRNQEPKLDVLTPRQIVLALRDGGMPVSAIAEAMRVERKTIYSWLSGGEVRGANAERAALVYRLLTAMPDIDLLIVYRFWNTPVEGRTLRGLMCAEKLDEDLATVILERLRLPAQKISSPVRRMARKAGGNPVLDEIAEAVSSR
jgi:hypothetical protein